MGNNTCNKLLSRTAQYVCDPYKYHSARQDSHHFPPPCTNPDTPRSRQFGREMSTQQHMAAVDKVTFSCSHLSNKLPPETPRGTTSLNHVCHRCQKRRDEAQRDDIEDLRGAEIARLEMRIASLERELTTTTAAATRELRDRLRSHGPSHDQVIVGQQLEGMRRRMQAVQRRMKQELDGVKAYSESIWGT